MIRKAMKVLVVALAAVLLAGSLAEAAPRRVVRHRVKHSTRVTRPGGTVHVKRRVRRRTVAGTTTTTKRDTIVKRQSTKPR